MSFYFRRLLVTQPDGSISYAIGPGGDPHQFALRQADIYDHYMQFVGNLENNARQRREQRLNVINEELQTTNRELEIFREFFHVVEHGLTSDNADVETLVGRFHHFNTISEEEGLDYLEEVIQLFDSTMEEKRHLEQEREANAIPLNTVEPRENIQQV